MKPEDILSKSSLNFDARLSYSYDLLNGRKGQFRADRTQKQIDADTDHEAIEAFLAEFQDKPATLRTYTKECERLLIWSVLYLNKPLSSLTRDDFGLYIDFLKTPPPEWCGPKTKRYTKAWRPFTGALSESAINTALASINSLFSWLVNAGYLTGNPLGLIRKKIKSDSTPTEYRKIERYLDDDMWGALLDVVEAMPIKNEKDRYYFERMRFMITTFDLLAPRVSELANIKMKDFRHVADHWFWFVTGKGEKYGNVAMPGDMVEALIRWRKFLGLSPVPKSNENIPAIPFVTKSYKPIFTKPGIKPRRINQILKEFFEKAAVSLELGGQEDKAELLRRASAHWLRHTSITQKVKSGIDRRIAQLEARHTDGRTTDMYTHDEEVERAKQAQKHRIRWSNRNK